MARVTVLGAGGWGIAIANLLAGSDHQVTLWKHNPQQVNLLRTTRRDNSKLRGVEIHPAIEITHGLEDAISDARVLIIAVPAQNVRAVAEKMKSLISISTIVVSLAKGIEVSSLLRVSEILVSVLGADHRDQIVAVSGPSHAEEVARSIPTSVVAAGVSPDNCTEIQRLLSTRTFRVYTSDDIVGVELGGALKNVVALASGMLAGLRLGDNTTGALLTRGLAEMTRLGVKMSARAETFAGLSGLGDLVTTCVSPFSRNRSVGERIGRGESLSEILASMSMVAEGVPTTRAAVRLADKLGVEMPITQQVYEVLFDSKPPSQAVTELMTRELRSEIYC